MTPDQYSGLRPQAKLAKRPIITHVILRTVIIKNKPSAANFVKERAVSPNEGDRLHGADIK
jgi:hypothetical protein